MSETCEKITVDGVTLTSEEMSNIVMVEYIDNDCKHADDLQMLVNVTNYFKKNQSISLSFQTTNYRQTQKAAIMNCGIFYVDCIKRSDIPGLNIVKASAIPADTSNVRQKKKCRAWEKINLKELGGQLASENGLSFIYASELNPVFRRKEQKWMPDLRFLSDLCNDAGLAMKVTNGAIVIYSSYEYGEKAVLRTFESGDAEIDDCELHYWENDTAYGKCHASYMDPVTGELIEYMYIIDETGKTLEITRKASSTEEARLMAKYAIMEKNAKEYTGKIVCEGDITLATGTVIQLKGYKEFDMKYIIVKAIHRIRDGIYKTTIWFEKVLEGY